MRYQKLLTLQDRVAEQIIQGLELNLSSSEAAQLKVDEPGDPLAFEYYLRGVDLYSRSDFPLAIRMLEKSAEIDPKYALTWAYLGRSYNASGSFQLEGRDFYRRAQAAADFNRAYELNPALLHPQVGKALSDGLAHQEAEGLNILRRAESRVQERGVGDSEAIYKLAEAYAILGDKQSALRLLKHSIDNGFFSYPYFVTDPLLDSLRGMPQLRELLQRARERHEAFRKAFF